MPTCKWCGKQFNIGAVSGIDGYCSKQCTTMAKARQGSSSGGSSGGDMASLGRGLKYIGMIFIAVGIIFYFLCYKFPKFLMSKSKKLLYAYIITWVVLIGGAVIYFSFFSPEAVSGIKTEIVSASCETEERFLSILKEALSKVSYTRIEGEEFTAYSTQAHNVVKERNSVFNDAVYSVKLPDRVNVYVWFKTKDDATVFAYKPK
jgi:hypothetical protein